jgi:hypothetical protein
MAAMSISTLKRCLRLLALLLALGHGAGAVLAQADDNGDAAQALRARQAALQTALASSPFGRPLVLQSTQDKNDLKGDVYVVVDHPFATVRSALSQAANWCDILILHLNIKQCRSQPNAVSVNVGKKYDQPIEQTNRIDFDYKVAASSDAFLQVRLSADEGPLGTRDYRILLEAVPLDAGHSFLHMGYAYGYGTAARIAMKAYLATVGSGKVGFSVVGKDEEGKPQYVGGVLGVVERNTMRYYLAIDAYLDSLALPAGEQQDKRLRDWFAATERYARQLHELNENEYLTMKKSEVARQQEK